MQLICFLFISFIEMNEFKNGEHVITKYPLWIIYIFICILCTESHVVKCLCDMWIQCGFQELSMCDVWIENILCGNANESLKLNLSKMWKKKQRRVLRTSIWVLKWELLSSLAVQSRLSVIYVQNITPIFHYNILFIPNSEHFWWVLLASDAVMCRIWV